MDVFVQIAQQIIKEQQHIIGPLATEQAEKVPGLRFTETKELSLNGDRPQIIDALVGQYAQIFGPASVFVCKEAAAHLLSGLPPEQVPSTLR